MNMFSLIFQFRPQSPLDREIDAYTTDLISVIQYYKYWLIYWRTTYMCLRFPLECFSALCIQTHKHRTPHNRRILLNASSRQIVFHFWLRRWLKWWFMCTAQVRRLVMSFTINNVSVNEMGKYLLKVLLLLEILFWTMFAGSSRNSYQFLNVLLIRKCREIHSTPD